MSSLTPFETSQATFAERHRVLVVCGAIAGIAAIAASLVRGRPPVPLGTLLISTEKVRVRVVPITDGLERPWALAFLPGGDILATELAGRLRLIHEGRLEAQPIEGIPAVETRDQAGLMDVALHPQFAQNGLVYFTYSKIGPSGNSPALGQARFDGRHLSNWRDIFVSDAWSQRGGNTGSRIVFGIDGTIYMSVGDRGEQPPAQDLRTTKGKVLRLRDDGTVPSDNPFVQFPQARPEIFVLGVRNPQGLFVDPGTGAIWENEHGPRGGDEVNVLLPGHNYGWPAITYGKNYDGSIVSYETARDGMDQPLLYWTPSIAPSGLTIYTGDRFPAWRGNVFVGALAGAHLRRIVFQDRRAIHQEVLLGHIGKRIRDVRQGPDGLLYVLTEAGALLRLEPAS